MQSKNPYSMYANNSINTASNQELTLMLYDGAIKFGNKSIDALKARNYQESNMYNQRVQDIVRELQVTLDRKYPISQQYNQLYEYIYGKLTQSNAEKSVEAMEEAIDLLREFRDVWKQAMQIVKTQNAGVKTQMSQMN